MLGSVRELLAGIIDYAGLFPPAKLELPHALRDFTGNLAGPDDWMLGRFVCPISQAPEAAQILRAMKLRPARPRFSLLPRQGANLNEFIRSLREDAARLAESRLAELGQAGDVWEIRLPADVGGGERPAELGRLLDAVDDVLAPAGARFLFYEAATAPPVSLFRCLSEHGESAGKVRVGFKLRTGGLEAAAFPSPEKIAQVLVACRETGLSLKFTAGLHHPVRRFDSQIGSSMYGFFNVFGAALLAHTHSLDVEQLRPVLLEEDSSKFVFSETEFGWKEYRIGVDALRELRKNNVISFGSCSFDEPRDDLQALGLLP